MIVADTSALLAVVLGEPDAERYLAVLIAEQVLLSAASQLEAAIVAEARQGPDATRDLHLLIADTVSDVVPVDESHAHAAFAAWVRFGKGRHPAGLNYGACMSYATARLANAPLLFKGDDFGQTDVARAL